MGPEKRERTAAWFAGFVPATQPQYAFAALYEGDVDANVHGGSHAAPMIGKIFREVYKGAGKKKRARAQPVEDEPPEEEEERGLRRQDLRTARASTPDAESCGGGFGVRSFRSPWMRKSDALF